MKLFFKNSLLSLVAVLLIASGFFALANRAFADITLVPATHGEQISADKAGTEWTELNGPFLYEDSAGQIQAGTITLTAPDGFVFDTTRPATVFVAGNLDPENNINNAVNGTHLPTVTTASQVEFIVTEASEAINTLTWVGIYVMPSAGTPLASGNISLTSTSPIGSIALPANAGVLSEIPGAIDSVLSTVASTPGTVTTDGGVGADIKITVKDSFGNPISGIPSSKITFFATGTGNTLTQPSLATDGNGETMGRISSSKAETKIITVIVDGVSIEGSTSITFEHGVLNHITVSPSEPQNIEWGDTINFSAQGFDINNNPIPELVYNWAVIPGTGNGTIGSDGIFTATGAGTVTVSAAVGPISATSETITINSRLLTITADPKNKTYGENDPELTYQVEGALLPGDNLAGQLSRVAGENVGTYEIGQGSLTAPGNYQITYVPANFEITPATLVILTDPYNKTYDGTTETGVHLAIESGLVAGDEITIDYEASNFENKNAGSFKTVNVTGITISGPQSGNYTFEETVTGTASIYQAFLTVTAVADSKVYDGTTSSTGTPDVFQNIAQGDTPNFIQTFDTKNVGAGKTLTPSGIVEDGNEGNNYEYEFVWWDGEITQKELTIIATADNKEYDGTTTATVNLTTDAVEGDDVVVNYATAEFDSADVGLAKTVTVSGITVSGGNAGNYYIANTTATTLADITNRQITVTADNQTKEYGQADPELTYQVTSGSLLEGDEITGSLEREAGEAVGTYAITQGTLNLNGNYELSFVDGVFTVTEIGLTATVTAENKTYDGTSNANILSCVLEGVTEGDDVECVVEEASFENRNAGQGKTVTANIALAGEDSANYSLPSTTATTLADILQLPLTVTAVADAKVYNGTTVSYGNPVLSAELIEGDTANFLQAFDTKNVGANRLLVPEGIVEDGNEGNNYVYTFETAAGEIMPKEITVSATAESKEYDGTTTATVNLTTDAIEGDDVTVEYATAEFDSADVGLAKTVTVSGITVSGADGTNYYLANTTATALADITNRQITVTADSLAKEYGQPDPELTYQITNGSLLEGDEITGSLEREAGEAVGTYAITQGTLDLSGNYDLNFVGGVFTVTTAVPVITWDNPQDVLAGTALDAEQLNATANVDGTFTYNPEIGTVLTTAGLQVLSVTFTPSDSVNYGQTEATVELNVLPAEITGFGLMASPESLKFGETSVITITGQDQFGNTVTNNNTAQFVLSADNGGILDNTILTLSEGIATANLGKDSVGAVHVTATSNGLAPQSITVDFTEADTSSPFIQNSYPANDSENINTTVSPYLVFSEPLAVATVNSSNIYLVKSGGEIIPATVSADFMEGKQRVTITPNSNLNFNAQYYFVVTNGVTDLAGNQAIPTNETSDPNYSFATMQESTELRVDAISTIKTYATADGTYENGWSWIFKITAPTGETELQMKFADWISAMGTIPAGGNIRYSSQQASNGPVEITEPGIYGNALNLIGDLDASASGRQIEVLVEASVPQGTVGGSYSTSYGVSTISE